MAHRLKAMLCDGNALPRKTAEASKIEFIAAIPNGYNQYWRGIIL